MLILVLILQNFQCTVCTGKVGSGSQRKPSGKERHKLAAEGQIDIWTEIIRTEGLQVGHNLNK